jgi:glycosyltransferase involved in cell wall biosynthesis
MDAAQKSSCSGGNTGQGTGPEPTRRFRVLHVLSSEVRGGIEEGVLSLLRNFNRTRFSVALACPPGLIQAYGRELESLDVDVYPLPSLSRPYQLSAMSRLFRILRVAAPDIVHTHLFVSSLCVAPLAKLCGVPVVIESCRIKEGWRHGLWKSYAIDRWVERFIDANIAISESLRRYLIEGKGFPPKNVVMIRNGRELSQVLVAREKDISHLREEFSLRDDELVVVVPGRLEIQKGLCYFIQALPTVLRRFPKVRVLFVGDGSLRAQLSADVAQRNLTKLVIFTGYRKDVYDLICLADLVVLPSLYEGLPLTAIETGALGKTIVATCVDGTPEVVLHGQTGWLVAPRRPEELAEAMCKLLGDPHLREALGKSAQEFVLREYSFDRLLRETEQLYQKLCIAEGICGTGN